jgi:D-glycero-beta-D-manno-heptose 1-phosphate adenylyltransferase
MEAVERMLGWDDAAALVRELRSAGKRIVLTNGVFDILHPGHVRYLQAARREGDALIVAINSDESVRRVKGPGRPYAPERERAELLASLDCVDAVVIFDQPDPAGIVAHVQPDVLVKGADWRLDEIIGRDIVEARGGRVVRIPIADGYSTSGIIARIKSGVQ